MSSIDQDSKIVEAVARGIAGDLSRQDYDNWTPPSDWDFTWAYIDQGRVDFREVARAIIPIVLEEAAGVAGSFATKARGREPENVYDSALYTAGHTIADAIRSLASDVKEEGR
jgi:hypothetical protein